MSRAVGSRPPLESKAGEEQSVIDVEDYCDRLRGKTSSERGQRDDSGLLPDWFTRGKDTEPERGADHERDIISHGNSL